MGDRSIGETLEALRGDFPDISVSKIRFLESQGLVNPNRTQSGYRKFSEDDVALLRWILRQQREHYLPLKVIRRKLRDGEGPGSSTVDDDHDDDNDKAAGEPAGVEPATSPAAPDVPPAPSAPSPWKQPARRSYTRAELAREAGTDEKTLADLESFGMLPDELDDEAVAVAELAARFAAYGVEARHLRMYKTFAEREAALLNQVVMPISVGGRDSGEAARDALADLARLGAELRLSMLRIALGPPRT
ncbi:MAG: transcriptional regulator FtsR [Acidimicrobiia bacterium]